MPSDLLADSKRARQLRKQAEALAGKPELFQALGAACLDPARHAAALAKPLALLKKAGISLPEGLAFELFEQPPRYLPFPDWTPWVIELTQCRTVWVLECDDAPAADGTRKCKLSEEKFCLGYRIYPRPWPRGPFSL
jgi:hypothetical protein